MSPSPEALEPVQEHRIPHSFPAGYTYPDHNPNLRCYWKVGIYHCTHVHRPFLIPNDKNQLNKYVRVTYRTQAMEFETANFVNWEKMCRQIISGTAANTERAVHLHLHTV